MADYWDHGNHSCRSVQTGGKPVPDDQEEPQRVFGIPLGSARPVIVEGEDQRVLGLPVRWFEPIGRDASRSLARLINAGKALLSKGR
jgi:hypothetical protein